MTTDYKPHDASSEEETEEHLVRRSRNRVLGDGQKSTRQHAQCQMDSSQDDVASLTTPLLTSIVDAVKGREAAPQQSITRAADLEQGKVAATDPSTQQLTRTSSDPKSISNTTIPPAYTTIPPAYTTIHACIVDETAPQQWITQAADLEQGIVATGLSTTQQTQAADLEQGIVATGLSTTQQTQNPPGGNESATEDKGKKTKDDPASDITHIVMVLYAFYGVMLGYLGWGPTDQSPRKSHPIFYWASVALLAYVSFALFGVLRMLKIGGACTRWARFLSFTIYVAGLIGSEILIGLVSLH